MKEAAVKGDEYRVWWCSLFVVFMWGSSCVMTPLILTSDVLLTQALSIWSWTNLLSFVVSALIFVSHSLDSLYHITMLLFLNVLSLFVHYVSFKTCLVFIFSECPTMKSSGTRTTSSLSSTSSWWCTWSGRSQTTDGSTKSTCVCVNGYVGLSLHESVSPEDKIRVCFMYECQQISETPTDNWRHL